MLTIQQVDFEQLFSAWMIGAQKLITDSYVKDGYGPGGKYEKLSIPQLWFQRGKKYIRVVREAHEHDRSAHCFIDTTNGNILKAASWKAPELNHARGNLFDATGGLSWMGVYGPATLR